MRPASASRSTHQIDHSVRQPNVILAAGAQRCRKLGCRPYLIYAEIRMGLTPCLNLLFSQSVRAPQTLFASQAAKISERAGGRVRPSRDGATGQVSTDTRSEPPISREHGHRAQPLLIAWPCIAQSAIELCGCHQKNYQKLIFFV